MNIMGLSDETKSFLNRGISALEDMAHAMKVLAAQHDSIRVLNTEDNTVAVYEDNPYELTETELAGILYRMEGWMSADRNWSSRAVARELLKYYKIERKI